MIMGDLNMKLIEEDDKSLHIKEEVENDKLLR